MKKYFTLSLVLLAFVFSSRAQIVTIDPNTFDLHISADEQGDANSNVYNTSTSTKTFRWIRSVEGAPAAWTTTVCDKNNCYSTTTSTQEFVLSGGASGLLKLTLNPYETPGQATYQILVYDVNDSANANAVFTVNTVVENMTGITDPVNNGVSIYPIPAKDVLNINLETVKNVNSIAIYNVVGQKLKTVNVSSGTKVVAVPVADMKKGVYFLRVYSNGKEAVTKTFTKE